MANQMTPDELREAAKRVHVSEPFHAEACRRLADAIEHAERIAGSTRADSPYVLERAIHQSALRILAIARGETNERETPCD